MSKALKERREQIIIWENFQGRKIASAKALRLEEQQDVRIPGR